MSVAVLEPLRSRTGTLVLTRRPAAMPGERPTALDEPSAATTLPATTAANPSTATSPTPAAPSTEEPHVTPLERLRLAAALGHAVPASELRLLTPDGETIIVSAHPAADIDPCAMRRVVRAFACPDNVDHSRRVAAVEFGGALDDLGGGVFRVAHHGIEQRWVASLLAPARIAELLDEVGLDAVPDDALHGCLKPDPELGVTLLVITADDERYLDVLDAIAMQAAAAIFVEELRCTASLNPSFGRTSEEAS